MRSHVNMLSSEAFEGRETGQRGERLAAQWLDSVFTTMGLDPAGEQGSRQAFHYKPHPPMQMHGSGDSVALGMALVQEIEGINVLYSQRGQNGGTRYGVIAAHYDHLGYGDENSLFRGDSTIHFGADDNASGVAGILEIAQRLVMNPSLNPILLAGFSGEEKGLWGSNHYCKNPTVPLDSIKYMINFDMIGRLRGDTLAVYGTGTSPGWTDLLDRCNTDHLILVPSESGVGPSDHTSFYLEGIPVLHFFTGQHSDYHKPSDTPNKVEVEGIRKVVDFTERIMRALDSEVEWPFTATVDQTSSDSPRFKVTLGVIPDYLFSGVGMRIDGVSDGRPASNSGMQRGDIVIGIDTVEVLEMMSYMTALSLFEPGESSVVRLIRDSEPLEVVVTWD